jgi:hypothetical protein
VALRWLIYQETAAIPNATSEDHLEGKFDVFDLERGDEGGGGRHLRTAMLERHPKRLPAIDDLLGGSLDLFGELLWIGRYVYVEDAPVLAEPQFDERPGLIFDSADRLPLLVPILLLGRQLGEAPYRFLVYEVTGIVQSDLHDDTSFVDGPLHGLADLVGDAVQELATGEILGDLPYPMQDLTDGLLSGFGDLSYLAGRLPRGPCDPTGRSSSGLPCSSHNPIGFPHGLLLCLRGWCRARHVLRSEVTSRPVERFLNLRAGANHIPDPCLRLALRKLVLQLL